MARPAAVVVILAVILAGCPQGTGGDIGFNGEINASDQGFRLDGEVVNTGFSEPTYHNVTVYLYTKDGTVITTENLGTLADNGSSLAVSIQTDRIPEFVIFNSPDFWQHEGSINVEYYEYREESRIYAAESIAARNEFPVKVPPNVTAT